VIKGCTQSPTPTCRSAFVCRRATARVKAPNVRRQQAGLGTVLLVLGASSALAPRETPSSVVVQVGIVPWNSRASTATTKKRGGARARARARRLDYNRLPEEPRRRPSSFQRTVPQGPHHRLDDSNRNPTWRGTYWPGGRIEASAPPPPPLPPTIRPHPRSGADPSWGGVGAPSARPSGPSQPPRRPRDAARDGLGVWGGRGPSPCQAHTSSYPALVRSISLCLERTGRDVELA
jgi:hypothetical protein